MTITATGTTTAGGTLHYFISTNGAPALPYQNSVDDFEAWLIEMEHAPNYAAWREMEREARLKMILSFHLKQQYRPE